MDKIKKTDHFYLIDGSGYIFRAYYALPPLSRKIDGLPTGAGGEGGAGTALKAAL